MSAMTPHPDTLAAGRILTVAAGTGLLVPGLWLTFTTGPGVGLITAPLLTTTGAALLARLVYCTRRTP